MGAVMRARGKALAGSMLLLAAAVAAPALAGSEAAQVLKPAAVIDSPAPRQDPGEVSRRVDKLARGKAMGKQAGTVVVDATSGEVLYDDDAGFAIIPASTIKIATAAAALRLMGPDSRLITKTTRESGDLFLVGGGDVSLATARPKSEPYTADNHPFTSLRRLAKDTVSALESQGVSSVRLKVDDSLFSGPSWGPEWPAYYRGSGIVAPVQALMVDHGRAGRFGPAAPDPAKAAGDTFAGLLRKAGISVSSVDRGTSPSGAADVAEVRSAQLYRLVGEMLALSDNDMAESLFRLAGIAAGFGGSFDGGGRAVTKALSDLGIVALGANFADGSGLSKQDRLSPRGLADILARVVRGEDDLWAIGVGLPVAGVSGTLRNRFRQVDTRAGAGLVRAKTGTLTSMSSLAGFVRSASGRVLVFAAIANEARSSADAGHEIDRIAAEVATCGCSFPKG